jgi:hypothetical protein
MVQKLDRRRERVAEWAIDGPFSELSETRAKRSAFAVLGYVYPKTRLVREMRRRDHRVVSLADYHAWLFLRHPAASRPRKKLSGSDFPGLRPLASAANLESYSLPRTFRDQLAPMLNHAGHERKWIDGA